MMLENDAIMTRMMIERVSGKMISSFWEVVSDILQFGTIKYSMSDRPSLGTVSTTGAFRRISALRIGDILVVLVEAQ